VLTHEVPAGGLLRDGIQKTVLRLRRDMEVEHEHYVTALAVLAGDRPVLASASSGPYRRGPYIRLTKIDGCSPLSDIERPHGSGAVRALAVAGDVLLSGGDDGMVRLWRVGDSEAEAVDTIPVEAPIRSMAVLGGPIGETTVVVATTLGVAGIRLPRPGLRGDRPPRRPGRWTAPLRASASASRHGGRWRGRGVRRPRLAIRPGPRGAVR
jgi:hypothetical protein